MTSVRGQHLVPASLVLGLAGFVTWLSFTQEPADAFLFPRLISVFFLSLAVWNFARAALGLAKVGAGISNATLRNILPGLAVMLVYVFFAARGLGFYVASTLAFLVLYTLYDPTPIREMRGWLMRISITLGFMTVIYALFVLLLKVQTPRGLFF